ncbi:MAG: hypothetical protein HY676_00370 [Chloroflexi bacterium]|nr:hypothetical protein [Chloroflexota bacterium]
MTVGFVAGSTPYDLGPFLVYFPGVVVAVVVLMVLLKLGQWAWRARRARSGSRGKAE